MWNPPAEAMRTSDSAAAWRFSFPRGFRRIPAQGIRNDARGWRVTSFNNRAVCRSRTALLRCWAFSSARRPDSTPAGISGSRRTRPARRDLLLGVPSSSSAAERGWRESFVRCRGASRASAACGIELDEQVDERLNVARLVVLVQGLVYSCFTASMGTGIRPHCMRR